MEVVKINDAVINNFLFVSVVSRPRQVVKTHYIVFLCGVSTAVSILAAVSLSGIEINTRILLVK